MSAFSIVTWKKPSGLSLKRQRSQFYSFKTLYSSGEIDHV